MFACLLILYYFNFWGRRFESDLNTYSTSFSTTVDGRNSILIGPFFFKCGNSCSAILWECLGVLVLCDEHPTRAGFAPAAEVTQGSRSNTPARVHVGGKWPRTKHPRNTPASLRQNTNIARRRAQVVPAASGWPIPRLQYPDILLPEY